MNVTLPLWVDVVTGVLVLFGSLMAMVGSFGLLRLRRFFQRVHAPTLGATSGTWTITIAGALQFSMLREQLDLNAVLISIFIVLTVPVTTIFLMRAALFRARIARQDVPPSVTEPAPQNSPPRAV